MPEQEPQPRNLFEEYVALLADRAELQGMIGEDLAGEQLTEARNWIADINGQIDDVSIQDGFAESLLAGGVRAARMLQGLDHPLNKMRFSREDLDERREPLLTRLQIAANFVGEYGLSGTEAERILAVAEGAGVQAVSQAIIVRLDEGRPGEGKVHNAAAADTIPDPIASRQGSAEQSLVDTYFSFRDAALILACFARFQDLLREHKIELPMLDEALHAALGPEDQQELVELAQQRADAWARLGVLLQDSQLTERAFAHIPGSDPRREVLLYFRDELTPDRYALLADLIETEKIMAVTLYTPRRSGPVVSRVDIGHEKGRKVRTITSINLGPQVRPASAIEPASPAGIEVGVGLIGDEFSDEEFRLANACLAHTLFAASLIPEDFLSRTETYPISLLSSLLSESKLVSAVQQARKARLIPRRLDAVGQATVQEVIVAILHKRPGLHTFVTRHPDMVQRITASALRPKA